MEQAKFDRVVQTLRSNIQHAVVTPKCSGEPIDTAVDEEDLYPWLVWIVVRALEAEDGQ